MSRKSAETCAAAVLLVDVCRFVVLARAARFRSSALQNKRALWEIDLLDERVSDDLFLVSTIKRQTRSVVLLSIQPRSFCSFSLLARFSFFVGTYLSLGTINVLIVFVLMKLCCLFRLATAAEESDCSRLAVWRRFSRSASFVVLLARTTLENRILV